MSSSILNREKAKRLKIRLGDVYPLEPDDPNGEQFLKPSTLALAKKALKTVDAYHRLADIADRYIKEIETRVELGYRVPEADLKFMSDFSEELARV